MKNIELHDINTWPLELIELIEENYQFLLKRLSEIKNFSERREEVIKKIEKIIKRHQMILYHCTRLLDAEILEIKINGLLPLSLELINAKLEKAKELNFLSEKTKEDLLLNNEVTDEDREGKIFFVCGASSLSEEEGVFDLLSLWGGEALYNSHDQNHLLRKIGTPCIIKCLINTEKFQLNDGELLAERFEAVYLEYKTKEPALPSFDEFIIEPLLPNRIIEIYKKDDFEFKELTSYHTWEGTLC